MSIAAGSRQKQARKCSCERGHRAVSEVALSSFPLFREETMPDNFRGAAMPLADADLDAAAADLGCERAVIDAVCDVESSGGGFLADGRPKILFEAHAFHKATGGRWDRTNPNISSPEWDRSLYGAGGAHQYESARRGHWARSRCRPAKRLMGPLSGEQLRRGQFRRCRGVRAGDVRS